MEKSGIMTEKIKGGEFIVEEGTWAFYAYAIESGKANVFKTVHGKQVQIGTLKKGDFFGEMAFLGGAKRTASVVADGDVEVRMIPKDTFMEAIEGLPADVRAKLDGMVSDLTCISEIRGHLIARLQDVENMKARLIDVKSFEKQIEKMPDLLRGTAMALAQRLNGAIHGCAQLTTQIEEAVKPIEALSVNLTQKSG
jgi:Cyclic nucleotide-binding domain